MEWWKLFSGTFILIFLAELGDKTQLAAMAKTADSPDNSMAKWIVFMAASLALVASTFIAVFLGHLLKVVVPDERYIKLAAGTLFLVFGGMILYETYRSFHPAAPAVAVAPAPMPGPEERGIIGGLALHAAMDFEMAAGARYRRLAAGASRRLSKVLLDLARDEDSHLARLQSMPVKGAEGDTAVAAVGQAKLDIGAGDTATVAELVRHEEATAEFYQALADRSIIPSVKNVFGRLANEERGHAKRLAAYKA